MPIGRLICSSGILRNGSMFSVSVIIPVYGEDQKKLLFLCVLPELIDQKAAQIVKKNIEQHEKNQLWLAPAVEHKINKKQKNISSLARNDVIDQKR